MVTFSSLTTILPDMPKILGIKEFIPTELPGMPNCDGDVVDETIQETIWIIFRTKPKGTKW